MNDKAVTETSMDASGNGDDILVTIVIPAKNEAENLDFLVDEIAEAFAGKVFEIIVVDDGSTDNTADVLGDKRANGAHWLRHICHETSCGQSASVRTGMRHAKGRYIATIDGDGENNPAYLPIMVDMLEAEAPRVGIVAGQRLGRKASAFKRFASRFANKVRGGILKDGTRDSGCGLKALPKSVFEALPYFDAWHRFLPALVIREGFEVRHLDVQDRQRRHGTSKYGIWDRAWVGLVDLMGVWWLRKRRKSVPVVSEVTRNVG